MTQLTVASITVVVRSLPAPPPAAPVAAGGTASSPSTPAVRVSPLRGATSTTGRPARPRRTPTATGPDLVLRQPFVPLGLDSDGALEVPKRAQDVGRWKDGPVPGDVGPAILVGHVDLNGRSGVFSRLSLLREGDRVDVARPDGRLVRFRVTRSLRFPKSAFPTDEVYSPTGATELRLITCGGSFDRLTGHYRDNVVVFAVRA